MDVFDFWEILKAFKILNFKFFAVGQNQPHRRCLAGLPVVLRLDNHAPLLPADAQTVRADSHLTRGLKYSSAFP